MLSTAIIILGMILAAVALMHAADHENDRVRWNPTTDDAETGQSPAADGAPPAVVPPAPLAVPEANAASVTDPTGSELPLPAMDSEGKLLEDVLCRQCGYNLRGLSSLASCPECELQIVRSMFGEELRFCDPAWLRRLDIGMKAMLVGILASIGLGIGMGIGMAVYGALVGGAMPSATALTAFGLLAALPVLVWVAGAWLLTTPDPGASDEEPPISARSLARWCFLVSVAAMPLNMVMQQQINFGAAGVTMPGAPLLIVSNLLQLITLVGTAAGIEYLRTLALRIPNPGLGKQMRIAGWGYVLTTFVLTVLGAAVWLTVGPALAGAAAPLTMMIVWGLGSCALGIAALAFSVWAIVLLFLYAAAFGRARTAAEEFASFSPDKTGLA